MQSMPAPTSALAFDADGCANYCADYFVVDELPDPDEGVLPGVDGVGVSDDDGEVLEDDGDEPEAPDAPEPDVPEDAPAAPDGEELDGDELDGDVLGEGDEDDDEPDGAVLLDELDDAPPLVPEVDESLDGAEPADGVLGVDGVVELDAPGDAEVLPAVPLEVEPAPAPDVPLGLLPPPESLLHPASSAASMPAATSALDGLENDFIFGSFHEKFLTSCSRHFLLQRTRQVLRFTTPLPCHAIVPGLSSVPDMPALAATDRPALYMTEKMPSRMQEPRIPVLPCCDSRKGVKVRTIS